MTQHQQIRAEVHELIRRLTLIQYLTEVSIRGARSYMLPHATNEMTLAPQVSHGKNRTFVPANTVHYLDEISR